MLLVVQLSQLLCVKLAASSVAALHIDDSHCKINSMRQQDKFPNLSACSTKLLCTHYTIDLSAKLQEGRLREIERQP